MTTKVTKCFRCGTDLERIDYVEPDWLGSYNFQRRSPLCQPCWVKADAEASAKHSASSGELAAQSGHKEGKHENALGDNLGLPGRTH